MSRGDARPEYDVTKVEAVLLQVAAELHPRRRTAGELALAVVGDSEDRREMDTARRAIAGLKEFGLLGDRDDGTVGLTPAGLHAVALLT